MDHTILATHRERLPGSMRKPRPSWAFGTVRRAGVHFPERTADASEIRWAETGSGGGGASLLL